MDFLAKIFIIWVLYQILFFQNTFSQSKYNETWIFQTEIKEGYTLFTVILQKDSLQRYTKGYIYYVQKQIPFDSICVKKQGLDLYFRDVFGMNAIFSCNFAITSSQMSGTWTRYHCFEKITSNIQGTLEPYSNYLENSKRHYNNDFLKGSWQVFFEDNTKGTLIFDNYEVTNIIIATINTPFLNFEKIDCYVEIDCHVFAIFDEIYKLFS
jgi:hypothetical protein